MKELVFELGTEELPPKLITNIEKQLQEQMIALLAENKLCYSNLVVEVGPRRLTVLISGLPNKLEPITKKIRGPAAGNKKIAESFAKAQKISVKSLKIEDNRLVAIKKISSSKVADILISTINTACSRLHFPRAMRWGEHSFIRPVRWVLMVFGGQTIKSSFYGVATSAYSYGHRFLANKKFKVSSIKSYLAGLKKHLVIFSRGKKITLIALSLKRRKISAPHELIDEVANMVEYPLVLVGSFDKKFISLPTILRQEVLQSHQRYFPYKNSNKFMFVANGKYSNSAQKNIIEGNQRVVAPRLHDAEFFLEADKKNLEVLSRLSEESDKIISLKIFVGKYFEVTNNTISADLILSLLVKAKADLHSNLVAEFPDLQGVVASLIFKYENVEQSIAVSDHYRPVYDGDELPRNSLGKQLATIDRLHSLIDLALDNKLATSHEDPYATRRLALGLIQLFLANDDLCGGLDICGLLKRLSPDNDSTMEKLAAFIIERFIHYQSRAGNKTIHAVPFEYYKNTTLRKIILHCDRISKAFQEKEKLISLKSSYKRLNNITKSFDNLKIGLMKDYYEQQIYSGTLDKNLYLLITEITASEDYEQLIKFEALLAEYFEQIFVMSGDALQDARLCLLANAKNLFDEFVILSKL